MKKQEKKKQDFNNMDIPLYIWPGKAEKLLKMVQATTLSIVFR